MSSGARPLTLRRLDLVVPSGWSPQPEPESDKLTDDIMEALIADVQPGASISEASPTPSLCRATARQCIAEARKAAVPKSTQKDTLWCIRIWKRNSRSEQQIPSDIISLSSSSQQQWLSVTSQGQEKGRKRISSRDSLPYRMRNYAFCSPKRKARSRLFQEPGLR